MVLNMETNNFSLSATRVSGKRSVKYGVKKCRGKLSRSHIMNAKYEAYKALSEVMAASGIKLGSNDPNFKKAKRKLNIELKAIGAWDRDIDRVMEAFRILYGTEYGRGGINGYAKEKGVPLNDRKDITFFIQPGDSEEDIKRRIDIEARSKQKSSRKISGYDITVEIGRL
jgi:hypothetical protein